MRLTRTEAGVVVARKGDHVTIQLQKGNKINVKIPKTDLMVCMKCHVAFDKAGKVVKVFGYDEPTVGGSVEPSEVEIFPSAEEQTLLSIDDGSVLETPECEDWESEEIELSLGSVLGDPSFEQAE